MASLLDNFWLKIGALVIGLLLWFHVATDKVFNHEVRLPLTEIVLEDSLTLANSPPESLTVMVSAPGKQLLRSGWREYGLRVNAAQYGTGRHAVVLTPTNTTLASSNSPVLVDGIVSPTSVTLNIDRLAEEQAEVKIDLMVEPDEGFAVSRIAEAEPASVTVRGAQSVVRRHRMVSTVPRRITGVRTNLSLTLPLVQPNGYEVTLVPDSVTVDIDIVPVKTRVFENIPIVVYNVPPGERVSIHPQVINVELTGPPEDIDLLNRNALVASVDYRRRSPENIGTIKVDTPANFRVKHKSADTVTFTIE